MRRILIAILLVASTLNVWAKTYTTTFPLTENPISDGGNWLNGKTDGLGWADIVTSGGAAHGTNTTVQYSDPTAILKGTWSADQMVEATVYSVNQTSSYYQEVELRLRSTMAPNSCSGYEIFFRCLKTSAAYTQIVRWNGPVASFNYLADMGGSQYGVANGDVVKATIVGNVITAYINGVQKAQATDNTFSTGNPGMGFNYGCNGTYGDFGFSSFMATDDATSSRSELLTTPARGQSSGRRMVLSLQSGSGVYVRIKKTEQSRAMIFDLSGHEIAQKSFNSIYAVSRY